MVEGLWTAIPSCNKILACLNCMQYCICEAMLRSFGRPMALAVAAPLSLSLTLLGGDKKY